MYKFNQQFLRKNLGSRQFCCFFRESLSSTHEIGGWKSRLTCKLTTFSRSDPWYDSQWEPVGLMAGPKLYNTSFDELVGYDSCPPLILGKKKRDWRVKGEWTSCLWTTHQHHESRKARVVYETGNVERKSNSIICLEDRTSSRSIGHFYMYTTVEPQNLTHNDLPVDPLSRKYRGKSPKKKNQIPEVT